MARNATAFLFACLLAGGCVRTRPTLVTIAPGVVFRRDEAAQVLDVDLFLASVRPVVVAENVERRRNNFIGDARTVREWADKYGAIGGLNGGFFGDTYDDAGRRKQIVGLAMMARSVVAPGALVTSTTRPEERFVRAAIGFTHGGAPDIAWASGSLKSGALRYDAPVNPPAGAPWNVVSAVACGPRLFARGNRQITDREERLRSPGALPRAFAAYDLVNGRPRHLVLGRADAMEFAAVADFLQSYFARVHKTTPHDALCLDGGPSAQLVYRDNDILRDAEPTGVLVPTALLLVPKQR